MGVDAGIPENTPSRLRRQPPPGGRAPPESGTRCHWGARPPPAAGHWGLAAAARRRRLPRGRCPEGAEGVDHACHSCYIRSHERTFHNPLPQRPHRSRPRTSARPNRSRAAALVRISSPVSIPLPAAEAHRRIHRGFLLPGSGVGGGVGRSSAFHRRGAGIRCAEDAVSRGAWNQSDAISELHCGSMHGRRVEAKRSGSGETDRGEKTPPVGFADSPLQGAGASSAARRRRLPWGRGRVAPVGVDAGARKNTPSRLRRQPPSMRRHVKGSPRRPMPLPLPTP